MPLAPGTQQEFEDLYFEVDECVVCIYRKKEAQDKKEDCFEADHELKPAGSGFVVHETERVTIIACHSSCVSESSSIRVVFRDGRSTSWNENVVVALGGALNLVFCDIRNKGGWKAAQYSNLREEPELGMEPEVVLTLVAVKQRLQSLRLLAFTSQIISPRCSAVETGNSNMHVIGSDQIFCFNLPAGGTIDRNEAGGFRKGSNRPCDPYESGYVLGAPVFNMEGHVVGFVHEFSYTFDVKFGMRIESFRNDLDKWLDGRTWEVAIEATITPTDPIFDFLDD